MGEYLNYMCVFVCGDCLAKTYFLPSIGQLSMLRFFSAKYLVSTKEYRKNLKKTFTFTH